MFSLIILLLTFSCDDAAVHSLSLSRANGLLFSSHSLHHSPVRGLADCVQLCLRHFQECSSLSYDQERRICDIFAIITGYPVGKLVFTTSVLLYEVSRTYRDCTDVKQRLSFKSGIYEIKPCSSCDAIRVYCDMDTDCKAWTVFQRRQDGSANFNQNWKKYKSGFGELSGEFWLGNKKIYEITSSAKYEFRIDMVGRDGSIYYVTYESIRVGNEAEKYRLDIGNYIEDKSTIAEALYDGHNGMSFSTFDQDNDKQDRPSLSCSSEWSSGWWFNTCFWSNLNGQFQSLGFIWDISRNPHYLRFSEMKMRKID